MARRDTTRRSFSPRSSLVSGCISNQRVSAQESTRVSPTETIKPAIKFPGFLIDTASQHTHLPKKPSSRKPPGNHLPSQNRTRDAPRGAAPQNTPIVVREEGAKQDWQKQRHVLDGGDGDEEGFWFESRVPSPELQAVEPRKEERSLEKPKSRFGRFLKFDVDDSEDGDDDDVGEVFSRDHVFPASHRRAGWSIGGVGRGGVGKVARTEGAQGVHRGGSPDVKEISRGFSRGDGGIQRGVQVPVSSITRSGYVDRERDVKMSSQGRRASGARSRGIPGGVVKRGDGQPASPIQPQPLSPALIKPPPNRNPRGRKLDQCSANKVNTTLSRAHKEIFEPNVQASVIENYFPTISQPQSKSKHSAAITQTSPSPSPSEISDDWILTSTTTTADSSDMADEAGVQGLAADIEDLENKVGWRGVRHALVGVLKGGARGFGGGMP